MTDFTVRFITERDEPQVIDLHRRVFPHERRTLEHQRWKYTANPFGEPIRVGSFAPDATLAAHVSSYALPMVDVVSGRARPLRAQQIGDSMTDPRFRRAGHGRRGPFAQAMQRLVLAGGERGMDVVYGVAPARLQRFYVRHIDGSEHLLDIPFLRAPLHDGSLAGLSAEPQGGGPAGYAVRPLSADASSDGHPLRVYRGGLDDLFDRVAPSYGMLVRRDAAYVEWRYQRSPDRSYLIGVAEHKGDTVGWSVFRADGDRLLWGDALFEPAHAAGVGALLTWAIRQSPAARRIEAWFRQAPAWWARELESLGLARVREPHDQSVISACYPDSPRSSGLTGDDLRRDLYMTMGDSDLF